METNGSAHGSQRSLLLTILPATALLATSTMGCFDPGWRVPFGSTTALWLVSWLGLGVEFALAAPLYISAPGLRRMAKALVVFSTIWIALLVVVGALLLIGGEVLFFSRFGVLVAPIAVAFLQPLAGPAVAGGLAARCAISLAEGESRGQPPCVRRTRSAVMVFGIVLFSWVLPVALPAVVTTTGRFLPIIFPGVPFVLAAWASWDLWKSGLLLTGRPLWLAVVGVLATIAVFGIFLPGSLGTTAHLISACALGFALTLTVSKSLPVTRLST